MSSEQYKTLRYINRCNQEVLFQNPQFLPGQVNSSAQSVTPKQFTRLEQDPNVPYIKGYRPSKFSTDLNDAIAGKRLTPRVNPGSISPPVVTEIPTTVVSSASTATTVGRNPFTEILDESFTIFSKDATIFVTDQNVVIDVKDPVKQNRIVSKKTYTPKNPDELGEEEVDEEVEEIIPTKEQKFVRRSSTGSVEVFDFDNEKKQIIKEEQEKSTATLIALWKTILEMNKQPINTSVMPVPAAAPATVPATAAVPMYLVSDVKKELDLLQRIQTSYLDLEKIVQQLYERLDVYTYFEGLPYEDKVLINNTRKRIIEVKNFRIPINLGERIENGKFFLKNPNIKFDQTRFHNITYSYLAKYNNTIKEICNLFYTLYSLEKKDAILFLQDEDKDKDKDKDIDIKFKTSVEPNKTPIRNYGNTCWVNSVIQMLYHIPQFRAGIIGLYQDTINNKLRLQPIMGDLGKIFTSLKEGKSPAEKDVKIFIDTINKQTEDIIKIDSSFDRKYFIYGEQESPLNLLKYIFECIAPWRKEDLQNNPKKANDFRYMFNVLKRDSDTLLPFIWIERDNFSMPNLPIDTNTFYECLDYVIFFYKDGEQKVNFADIQRAKFDNLDYTLIGILDHPPKHFHYYHLSVDNEWFLYDDTNILKQTPEDVIPVTFLVYKRVDFEEKGAAAYVKYIALPTDDYSLLPITDKDTDLEYLSS